MKIDIHPNYLEETSITCTSCNKVYNTGSTVADISVEICSNCHPFYTGTQRLVDTGQRIERFKKHMEKQQELSQTRSGKKAKREKRAEKKVASQEN